MTRKNETSYVLVGQRRGRIWYGRLRQRQTGQPASVEFDWDWVLDREERYGDVLGFYHTHPAGLAAPSDRDLRTWFRRLSWFSILLRGGRFAHRIRGSSQFSEIIQRGGSHERFAGQGGGLA